MKYLKKFFESVDDRPTHKLDVEDFEDLLLELTDVGYHISDFEKCWFDLNNGQSYSKPTHGKVIGYSMHISIKDEDYEGDLVYGYSSPTDLRSLQEEAQRSKSNFEKVISCLKTIEYSLGKVIIDDMDNPYSFNISVIQKGTDTISVDKKEEEFYDFVSKVRQQLNSTLRSGEYGEAEYTYVEDIKNYTVSIKFIDNLTRGRFNTAVNNIKTIKTGVRGYHRFSKRVADFQIDLSFPKKSINLSFEGYRTLS
jgi:hypothetical protein